MNLTPYPEEVNRIVYAWVLSPAFSAVHVIRDFGEPDFTVQELKQMGVDIGRIEHVIEHREGDRIWLKLGGSGSCAPLKAEPGQEVYGGFNLHYALFLYELLPLPNHKFHYVIDFDDGSKQEGDSEYGKTVSWRHVYTSPGTYTVRIWWTDDRGRSEVHDYCTYYVGVEPPFSRRRKIEERPPETSEKPRETGQEYQHVVSVEDPLTGEREDVAITVRDGEVEQHVEYLSEPVLSEDPRPSPLNPLTILGIAFSWIGALGLAARW